MKQIKAEKRREKREGERRKKKRRQKTVDSAKLGLPSHSLAVRSARSLDLSLSLSFSGGCWPAVSTALSMLWLAAPVYLPVVCGLFCTVVGPEGSSN